MTLDELTKKLCTEEWVKRVATTRDVDLRAHEVALTYWCFACAADNWINNDNSVWNRLTAQESPAPSNATWFNFATWATATINRDLALSILPNGVGRLFPGPVRRVVMPLLLHLKAEDGQRVSRALSWAQRLVFISTTLTFLARLEGWNQRETFDRIEEVAGWGGKLLGRRRHLSVIWLAFNKLAEAKRAATRIPNHDPAKRPELFRTVSQHILQANIMITAVEQDVVDEAVGDTINYLPQLLSSAAVRRAALFGDRFLDTPREITGLNLAFQVGPATDTLKTLWARFMTNQILVMVLPSETLRLGKDIPPLVATEPFFPPDLYARPGAEEPAGLSDLITTFDRTQGDGRGSGANDWRNYNDRMNWAVNMIRSRQQDPSLYWSPYSEQDQTRICDKKLPLRGGDPSDYDVLAPLQGFSRNGIPR